MVFESVLDTVNVPSVLKKSWFIEWFNGAQLKSYWDQNNITGVGAFAMADGVDEGFSISTDVNIADTSSIIDGNTERHFSPVGSVNIAIARRVSAVGRLFLGLGNRTDGDLGNTPDESIRFDDINTLTFKRFATINGVSSTTVNTSVAVDLLFHRIRQEATPTTTKGFIDGILEGTITTNLPDSGTKLYCGIVSSTLATSSSEVRIRYFEAFNT